MLAANREGFQRTRDSINATDLTDFDGCQEYLARATGLDLYYLNGLEAGWEDRDVSAWMGLERTEDATAGYHDGQAARLACQQAGMMD